MNLYKKINWYALVLSIALSVGSFMLMWMQCFNSCSYELRQAILRPLLLPTLLLAGTLTLLLFFKPIIFKHWLLFIAWWYLPLSIYIVSQTSIYAGNILAVNRSITALMLMIGLFAVTVVFLLVRYVVCKNV